MSDAMVSSALVPHLLARLREAGEDADAVAVRLGLSDAPRVSEGTLRALFNLTAQALGDDYLGLHLGAAMPRGAYGTLEMLCRVSPTVGELCERFTRYLPLIHPDIQVCIEVHGPRARFVRRRAHRSLRHEGRQLEELFLASCLQIGRAVTAGTLRVHGVMLGRRRPLNPAPLVHFFGTDDVRFGSDEIGYAFPAALLDQRCASADPEMAAILGQYADELLVRAPPSADDPLAKLEGQVKAQLEQGDATLESVARTLAMSPRTLQRELARRGLTFQRVLDDVRRDLAHHYMEGLGLPLSRIASLLGYTEQRCFTRAYRRWTGRSPREYVSVRRG
jgi:AraC-like DNA-binding protein